MTETVFKQPALFGHGDQIQSGSPLIKPHFRDSILKKLAGNPLKSAGKIPKCTSMMLPQSAYCPAQLCYAQLAFGTIESSGQDDNQGLAALRAQI
jgi:hypothetical protein